MRSDRSLPGVVAALVAGGALTALGGPLGAAAALALVGTWYAFGAIPAFAVGQVALVAVAGDWPLRYVAGGQIALFAIAVAPDLRTRRGRRLAGWTGALSSVLGATAFGAHRAWETTWVSAVILGGFVGLAAYGLHRYELVATGGVTREQ